MSEKQTLTCLILFSGTKSVEKRLNLIKEYNIKCISLDIEKKYNPTICQDILKWNYKEYFRQYLKDKKIDYIWASPVCKEFSQIKTLSNQKRDLTFGFLLLDKSLEIIDYVKQNINKDVLITIENPRNKYLREYKPLKQYKLNITSYCKYSYPYQKTTYFFTNFNIKLNDVCSKKCPCEFSKENNYHRVVLCYAKPNLYEKQIKDTEYYKEYKQSKEYDNTITNMTSLRYRIPGLLIDDIIKGILIKLKFISYRPKFRELTKRNRKRKSQIRINKSIERLMRYQEKMKEMKEDRLDFIDYD